MRGAGRDLGWERQPTSFVINPLPTETDWRSIPWEMEGKGVTHTL